MPHMCKTFNITKKKQMSTLNLRLLSGILAQKHFYLWSMENVTIAITKPWVIIHLSAVSSIAATVAYLWCFSVVNKLKCWIQKFWRNFKNFCRCQLQSYVLIVPCTTHLFVSGGIAIPRRLMVGGWRRGECRGCESPMLPWPCQWVCNVFQLTLTLKLFQQQTPWHFWVFWKHNTVLHI